MDQIAQVLLSNGIGGAMAIGVLWALYHTHTVTFPRMLDRFERQISEERQLSERRHTECMAGHKEVRHAVGNVAQSVTLLAHILKHDRDEPPGPGLTKGVQP